MDYYLYVDERDRLKLVFTSVDDFKKWAKGEMYCADTFHLGRKTIFDRIDKYGYCTFEYCESGCQHGYLEKVKDGRDDKEK